MSSNVGGRKKKKNNKKFSTKKNCLFLRSTLITLFLVSDDFWSGNTFVPILYFLYLVFIWFFFETHNFLFTSFFFLFFPFSSFFAINKFYKFIKRIGYYKCSICVAHTFYEFIALVTFCILRKSTSISFVFGIIFVKKLMRFLNGSFDIFFLQ